LQQPQQAPKHQGFARTHFAGNDDEPLVPSDTVVQGRERLVVPAGGKQEKRIRSDLEWITLQIVEGFVH